MRAGYYAHAIRGKYGDKSTPQQMTANCCRSTTNYLYLCELLPNWKIYLPAKHEILFQEAYLKGLITSDLILQQCYDIIKLCDVLFVGDSPDDSEGVKNEISYAYKNNIDVVHLYKFPKNNWKLFLKALLMEGKTGGPANAGGIVKPAKIK